MRWPLFAGHVGRCARTAAFVCVLTTLFTSAAPAGAAPLAHGQGPNLGTVAKGEVEIQLIATGGTGPYTWELVAGSLPPGVSLREPAPFHDPLASAALVGVATVPNSPIASDVYRFTLRVRTATEQADREYTLRISNFFIAEYWNLPDRFVGKSFSHQFEAGNNQGPVTWTATGVPAGMNVSSTGLLSGTPTGSGFFNIFLRANDGVDNVFRGVDIAIFDIEISTPGALPNATQNVPYNTNIVADGGTGAITFTSFDILPNGLVLTESGNISGTPNTGPGVYRFHVTATDANHVSYTKYMSLDVIGTPPTLAYVEPYNLFWDDCSFAIPCSRGVAVHSGGTAPFSWSATGLPPGMAIRFGSGATSSFVSPGDVELVGVPTALGTYNVELTNTDDTGATSTNTFTLRVSSIWKWSNLPPGTLGVPYSNAYRVLGGQLPYSVASVGGRLPVGLTLDAATRTVAGTPGESGFFELTNDFTDAVGNVIRVTDFFSIGGGASTLTFFSSDDLGTITVGSPFSFQFAACCVATPITWSVEDGTVPKGLTLSSSGLLSGVPTAPGTYVFLIRFADSANAANHGIRQVTVVVTPLAATTFSLPVGNVKTAYNVVLTASGGTNTFTWTLFSRFLPPGLTLASNGEISGTPTASGLYVFQVKATDGAGNILIRFFSISIYPAGQTAPLNLPFGPNLGPFVLGTLVLQLSPTGGTPPYHVSLTPGSAVVPGMRVQDGPPLPVNFSSATPGAYLGVIETPGVYHPSLRVTDALGSVFDRPITVTVSPLQLLTQFNWPKATAGTFYSFQLIPVGGVSNAYSFSATNLPAGFTIDASTGQVSGTTNSGGIFGPRITLTDLVTLQSITFNQSLVVDPFAIETNGVLPQALVGTFYSQTLSAPGCGTTCTWSSNIPMPNGLSFVDGTISGTPTGSTNFTPIITASGPNGTVQKVFWLPVVSNPRAALVITLGSPIADNTVGNNTAVALTAQGGTPPYAWMLESGTLPSGVSIQSPGETIGSNLIHGYSYLAGRARESGTASFTLAVTDADGRRVSKAFTWRISPLGNQYFNLPNAGSPLVYNQPYTQKLLTIGGTGHYSWAANGPMPTGLTLDSATGTVSGTPGVTGTVNVPIQATDDNGATFVAFINFNIAGTTPITLGFTTGPNLGTPQQGIFSTTVTPTGGTPPYTITPIGSLPAGFVLLPSTLSPAGTMTLTGLATPGNYSVTLHAQDAAGNIGVRTFTFRVAPFSVFNTFLADGSVDIPYSQPLQSADSSGTIAFAPLSAMPPGLSISANGVVNGTPSQAGTFNFQATATNASGAVSTLFLQVRISSLAIADPQILPQQVIVGQPFTYTFTAAGGGASLVWTATGLPAGLSMSPTGTISGTFFGAGGGTFTVIVTVTDGVVPLSRRFALYTRSPNRSLLDFPVAGAALTDATVGVPTTFTLLPNGGTPPYTWSVAAGSSLPAGMALVSGQALPGNFTPGATILTGVPTAAGRYTFDLIATDSAGTQTRRTFSLNVSPMTTVGNLAAATTGTAYTSQLAVVGGTAPYTLTFSPTSLVQDMLPPGFSMTASSSSNVTISGTTTSTGSYRFFLNVQDGAGRVFSRAFTLVVATPSGLQVTTVNPADTPLGAGRRPVLATNGASTYTWSLVDGTLPPGTALATDPIFLGPNITTVGGQPTAAGTFVYTLRATDDANPANSADHTFTWNVTPIQIVSPRVGILTVLDLPAGHVGDAYSFALRAAGGSPRYSFSESPFVPLPSWLTLSEEGVLSGTPPSVGSYIVSPIVVDRNGNRFSGINLTLPVGAAGTATPLLSAVPGGLTFFDASVGVPYSIFGLDGFLLRGGTAPFTFSVAPGSALPPGLFLVPGANGVPNGIAGTPTTPGPFTTDLIVSDSSGQVVHVLLDIRVFSFAVTTPDSLPAGVVGQPYSAPIAPAGAGVAPFSIQLLSNSDLPPGLSIDAAGALVGTPTAAGHFRVRFTANGGGSSLFKGYNLTIDNPAGEAPAVNVGPKPIQVYYEVGSPNPAAIPVSISTTSGVHAFQLSVGGVPGAALSSSSGATPASVALNLNLAGVATGTYVGLIGVSAPSSTNQFDATQVVVTVATPPPCAFTLNPTSSTVVAAGGSGSFNVAAGAACAWTATVSDPTWISIVSGASGSGSGIVRFSVVANTGATRTGSITVGGQTLAITQFGVTCGFTITPASMSATAVGGSASIAINASGARCAWTASGLGVTPASGFGSKTVTVTIPPNPDPNSRILSATIAGNTFTVNQAGIACTVSLSASGAAFTAAGGVGSVDITTPAACTYDTAPGPNWISVTSGGSGSGTGTLVYSVAPNNATSPRSGTLVVGGQPLQITQDPLPCTITVDTSGLGTPYGPAGGAGTIGITTNGGNCTWTASSDQSWISVSAGSGSGNGTVGVTVSSNAASVARREANLTIGGQTIGVVQAGTTCLFNLQSPSGSAPASGGAGSVGVVAPAVCSWTAVTNAPEWLTISSSGSGGTADVHFVAQPNSLPTPRSGTLTIAGQTYTVNQAPAPCSYTLSTTGTTVAAAGGSDSFSFTPSGGSCVPNVRSFVSWITVSSSPPSGGGTVMFSVDPNPFTTTRVGVIQVGDQTFLVTQTGAPCAYSLSAYGILFAHAGGSSALLGSRSAVGCTPDVGTDQPSFVTLGNLFGPTNNIFTLPYDVAPFDSLIGVYRRATISFGGQVLRIKQSSW